MAYTTADLDARPLYSDGDIDYEARTHGTGIQDTTPSGTLELTSGISGHLAERNNILLSHLRSFPKVQFHTCTTTRIAPIADYALV